MPAKPNEHRREQLLDDLEAIIKQEGFVHLRIGALADRLHCSRSTIYKLADSKDELIALIFQRIADAAVDEATVEADKLTDPAEKIVRYSDVIDRWQASISPQLWRDVAATPFVADVLSEKRARGYREVKRFLDEGVQQGKFRPANTDFVAYLVWIGAAATRDMELLERLGVDRAEANHEFARLIVDGMRASTPCED